MIENQAEVLYLNVNYASIRLFKQICKINLFNCNNCTVCWNVLEEVVASFSYLLLTESVDKRDAV